MFVLACTRGCNLHLIKNILDNCTRLKSNLIRFKPHEENNRILNPFAFQCCSISLNLPLQCGRVARPFQSSLIKNHKKPRSFIEKLREKKGSASSICGTAKNSLSHDK